jgi:uncharacterized membrane protein
VPGFRFRWRPTGPWAAVGCLGLLLLSCLTCLLPLLLADAMQSALERMHLSPTAALICVVGIFVGGLINLPLYRYPPPDVVPVERYPEMGPDGITWRFRELGPPAPVIAVNLGGCIIPVALAAWQVGFLTASGGVKLSMLAVVTAVNVGVCYFAARPIKGVGIVMPALLSPLVCVGLTWLTLPGSENELVRPGVAFIAGVFGPLIGEDLLHLKDVRNPQRGGVLSIGGAGTFDGIVISGMLAALIA